MFNNFFNIFRFCVGFRLFCLLGCIVLTIILFYQFIIALFIPCFLYTLLLFGEFCLLISLIFYTIFGF